MQGQHLKLEMVVLKICQDKAWVVGRRPIREEFKHDMEGNWHRYYIKRSLFSREFGDIQHSGNRIEELKRKAQGPC